MFEKLMPIAREANGDFQLFQTIVSYRFDMLKLKLNRLRIYFGSAHREAKSFLALTQKVEKRKEEPRVGPSIVKLRGFRNRY